MHRELNNLIDQNKKELIDLTLHLISMDTVKSNATEEHPYGKNMSASLKELMNYAKSKGLESVKNYDNKFAVIDLKSDNPDAKLFMVMNHLDVVEIGDKWSKNPYGEVIDGIIYGRGSTDNKGPLAASLLSFILLNKLNIKLNNNIRLFIGLDEENSFGCVNHYKFLNLKTPDIGITPDAKFPLVDREYGIFSGDYSVELNKKENIKIQTDNPSNVIPSQVMVTDDKINIIEGVSAHSAEPADGVNAIHKMINESNLQFENNIINDLFRRIHKELTGNRLIDEVNGKIIEYSFTRMNLENNELKFTIDARFDETIDADKLARKINEKYQLNQFITEKLRLENGYYLKESKFKNMLLENYKKFRPKDDLTPLTLKGTTYGKAFENIYPYGISFKDSPKSYAHGPDERMHIDKLLEGFTVLVNLIYEVAITEFKENEL